MICRSVANRCYAVMWSYGQICVGCGSCKRGAYKERLEYHRAQLKEARTFSNWAPEPELLALQKENRKANIAYELLKIRELRKKIAKRKERENV